MEEPKGSPHLLMLTRCSDPSRGFLRLRFALPAFGTTLPNRTGGVDEGFSHERSADTIVFSNHCSNHKREER